MRGWIFLGAAACVGTHHDTDAFGDSDPHETGDETELPADTDTARPADTGVDWVADGLYVSGTAATADDAEPRASCTWWVQVDDLRPTDAGWSGTVVAGEVIRDAGSGDDGGQFQAVVGGPATIAPTAGGLALRLFGEQPDDAIPFWLALESLSATGAPPLWTGTWTCAPTNAVYGAFTDDGPSVEGTFDVAVGGPPG